MVEPGPLQMTIPAVLFDGWALAFEPNSPAAIHLSTLLSSLPPGIQAFLALPDQPPHAIHEQVDVVISPATASESARLAWEQVRLPRLAKKLGAHGLHSCGGSPSLFKSGLVSPAGYDLSHWSDLTTISDRHEKVRSGIVSRLRQALVYGASNPSNGLLWPADLPPPPTSFKLFPLPPVLHAGIWQAGKTGPNTDRLYLPESYILYHGPESEIDLHNTLDAWHWAANVIGAYCPLVLLGLRPVARQKFEALAKAYALQDTIHALPALSPDQLFQVYSNCSALFHPARVSPWGDPIRMALACGKPVVALETTFTHAIVGPAAYLVKPGATSEDTSRALGAALITMIVEESLAESLGSSARQRASAWKLNHEPFSRGLSDIYLNFFIK